MYRNRKHVKGWQIFNKTFKLNICFSFPCVILKWTRFKSTFLKHAVSVAMFTASKIPKFTVTTPSRHSWMFESTIHGYGNYLLTCTCPYNESDTTACSGLKKNFFEQTITLNKNIPTGEDFFNNQCIFTIISPWKQVWSLYDLYDKENFPSQYALYYFNLYQLMEKNISKCRQSTIHTVSMVSTFETGKWFSYGHGLNFWICTRYVYFCYAIGGIHGLIYMK